MTVTVQLAPGAHAPAVWCNSSAEHHLPGERFCDGRPQEGDHYFGITGHH